MRAVKVPEKMSPELVNLREKNATKKQEFTAHASLMKDTTKTAPNLLQLIPSPIKQEMQEVESKTSEENDPSKTASDSPVESRAISPTSPTAKKPANLSVMHS